MTAASVTNTTIATDKALSGVSAPTRRKHRNVGDRVFFWILRGAAAVPIVLMLLFLGVLFYGAWPAIQAFGASFLFSSEWDPNPDHEQYGALSFVYGTLVSSILALALAAPVGIGVAAFLNEVFPQRLRSIIAFLIEILATIPSIVYGVWAFFILRAWVQDSIQPCFNKIFGTSFLLFSGPPLGLGLLTATLVLATMILPIIVSISLAAIRSVPNSYREAALGLGATRWEMIRLAVLPAARSGLLGACILAFGRALGETMAITMVIGNANKIGWSLFQPANTISSVIANQFGEADGLMLSSLIELALILFLMTLAVNLIARSIINKLSTAKGVIA